MDDALLTAGTILGLAVVGGTLVLAAWSRKLDVPAVTWLLGPAVLQIVGLGWIVWFHGAAFARGAAGAVEARQSIIAEGLGIAMSGGGVAYGVAAGVLAASTLWLLGPGRQAHRPRGPHRIFVAVLAWQTLSTFAQARTARTLGAMFAEAATVPPEIRMQLLAGTTASLATMRTVLWGLGAGAVLLTSVWAITTRREEFAGAGVWLRAAAVVAVLAALSAGRLVAQQMILARFSL